MSKQPGGGHAGHSGQGGQGQSQNAPKKSKGAKHGGSSTPASSKHHPQHKAPGSAGKHHHVHHTPQHPGSPLRLGDVSCCTFLAVAESAHLAGWNVDDSDVLSAYFALTDDPDRGLDIPIALEAASRYGIGPVRSLYWEQIPLEAAIPGCISLAMLNGELHALTAARGGALSWRKFWPNLEVALLSSWFVRWPS